MIHVHPTALRSLSLVVLAAASLAIGCAVPDDGADAAQATVAAVTAAAVTGAPVPLPTVTGPLAVTPTSHPFGAADHQLVPEDLGRLGYVEEEFIVSGAANVYDWPADGPAVVRTPAVPYTTRLLVRRPAHAARFSGTVVFEMLNPSNLFDLNIGWALLHEELVRRGHAWVGVTVKPVALEALRTFDPARYGTLTMANPLPLTDPGNCAAPYTMIAGDTRREDENGLAWDVFSQVGAWIRSQAASNPLRYHGHAVRHLYAFGYSQTGGYMTTYVNAIRPIASLDHGRPIFDGYVIGVSGGAFAGIVSINQCAPTPGATDPRRQVKDAGVPVIRVMSQSDYLLGIGARRPDGDVAPDLFRHYELAGSGHATPDELIHSAASEDIVAAGRSVPSMTCDGVPRSRFPSGRFYGAVLRNLDLWVRLGLPPPHADPIAVANGAPVLDAHGNVQGGIRSPYLDVPTSSWYGATSGPAFCFIAGHEVPFDAATLQALYPGHGDYVEKVAADVRALVRGRFLTPEDGVALIREAAHAQVP